ncbi:type II toxin-antitoxin system RelE/ParE family toxin [Cedecea davisae]|uniref:type II toxin-antitoxin system RelE/ParE family toxin n=1 Tax=Cedecea davisae TaxID=158484 RepID=UPI00376EE90A
MPILRHYLTQDGRDPFNAFLMDVKDPIAKAMIAVRVARMGAGNYGDCKPCREGVSELRIDRGPGYRVYYSPVPGSFTGDIVLLLLGGTKKKQNQDIEKSIRYLKDYKERK